MEIRHRENLKQLSRYMKDEVIAKGYAFDMDSYIGLTDGSRFNSKLNEFADNADCGTSACMLGWSVHAFGIADELREADDILDIAKVYIDLSLDYFGIGRENSNLDLFYFLFGENWGGDAEFAVARLDYFIEMDGVIPTDWNTDMDIEAIRCLS